MKNGKNKYLIYGLGFIVLFFVASMFIIGSFKVYDQESTNYSESSKIDYKVYLNENDFYEDQYLGMDMAYVSSLINKIDIGFNYLFNIDEKSNIEYTYSVDANLVISDSSKSKNYFEKSYNLLEAKKVNMSNNVSQSIKETISIDYNKFNSIANSFRSIYGVNTDSKLVVFMKVKKRDLNGAFSISDSVMNVIIPLSEKTTEIKLDYNEINNQSYVTKDSHVGIGNIVFLCLGIAIAIAAVVFAVKTVRLFISGLEKKSAYDKYIEKILKEYDRLIVETNNLQNFGDRQIIHLQKFTELLDVRDNLKLPVSYYCVEPHKRAYFYIAYDKVVYLVEFDSRDFKEGEKEVK